MVTQFSAIPQWLLGWPPCQFVSGVNGAVGIGLVLRFGQYWSIQYQVVLNWLQYWSIQYQVVLPSGLKVSMVPV